MPNFYYFLKVFLTGIKKYNVFPLTLEEIGFAGLANNSFGKKKTVLFSLTWKNLLDPEPFYLTDIFPHSFCALIILSFTGVFALFVGCEPRVVANCNEWLLISRVMVASSTPRCIFKKS